MNKYQVTSDYAEYFGDKDGVTWLKIVRTAVKLNFTYQLTVIFAAKFVWQSVIAFRWIQEGKGKTIQTHPAIQTHPILRQKTDNFQTMDFEANQGSYLIGDLNKQ